MKNLSQFPRKINAKFCYLEFSDHTDYEKAENIDKKNVDFKPYEFENSNTASNKPKLTEAEQREIDNQAKNEALASLEDIDGAVEAENRLPNEVQKIEFNPSLQNIADGKFDLNKDLPAFWDNFNKSLIGTSFEKQATNIENWAA